MSNIISADHDPAAEDVVMSNGMTSVFLSLLLLSGSDLARSDHEVATMAWLAEHDQATVGRRWDALSYPPNAEAVRHCLREFRELVAGFPVDACPVQPWGEIWSAAGLRSDRAMCPRHAVYLNSLCADDAECCLICNDEPVSQ